MNAFRRLIVVCVTALALISPILVPSQSHAAGTPAAAAQTRYYYVYYRSCPQSPWYYYGWFYRASDAQKAVRWIRSYGYEAFYR